MRFAFTDDQRELRDAVRDLLDRECGPDVVRAAWPEGPAGAGARAPAGAVESVWSRLDEMGVLAVGAPADQGGLGLGALDWVLLAEESGYAAVPHPVVEAMCVAGALGVTGARVATDLAGPVVPFAAGADVLLLRRSEELVLVPAAEAELSPAATVDGALAAAQVATPASGGRVVADGEDVRRAFDRGALGNAAQLVGLGQRMLDLTVAHVRERHQFGVPIGSFQAVKHHLADALMHLSFARPAVHRAAWSVAHDVAERSRDTSMAKALASAAAREVGAAALQCHGAIGYTVEYDLHLYLKRSWALAALWGDAAWHRDRVGRAIGA